MFLPIYRGTHSHVIRVHFLLPHASVRQEKVKIASELKTFEEKQVKIKIIWVLGKEKPSGLMNKAITSSPCFLLPFSQLPWPWPQSLGNSSCLAPALPRRTTGRMWLGHLLYAAPLWKDLKAPREHRVPTWKQISRTFWPKAIEEGAFFIELPTSSWSSSNSSHHP